MLNRLRRDELARRLSCLHRMASASAAIPQA
jgi:hypothetical protein